MSLALEVEREGDGRFIADVPDLPGVLASGATQDETVVRAQARRVLAAPPRIGWVVKRDARSHRVLVRDDWPDTVFAFGNGEEIGLRMLARVAKPTGLRPDDLGRSAADAADDDHR